MVEFLKKDHADVEKINNSCIPLSYDQSIYFSLHMRKLKGLLV